MEIVNSDNCLWEFASRKNRQRRCDQDSNYLYCKKVFCHRSKVLSPISGSQVQVWHWEEEPPEHLALRKQALTAGAPKNWEKDGSLLRSRK